MAVIKVYIADEKEENFVLLMHNDILGFQFEVLNAVVPPATVGTPYDFTGFTDVFLKIYNKARGKLILTIPESATNGVSIATNIITWNATYATDIPLFDVREYYFELSYLDANSKLISVLIGNVEIR